jgi:hypothetical protein
MHSVSSNAITATPPTTDPAIIPAIAPLDNSLLPPVFDAAVGEVVADETMVEGLRLETKVDDPTVTVVTGVMTLVTMVVACIMVEVVELDEVVEVLLVVELVEVSDVVDVVELDLEEVVAGVVVSGGGVEVVGLALIRRRDREERWIQWEY